MLPCFQIWRWQMTNLDANFGTIRNQSCSGLEKQQICKITQPNTRLESRPLPKCWIALIGWSEISQGNGD